MPLNQTARVEFSLDLIPGGIPPVVHCSQGDIDRLFVITTTRNGRGFDLSSCDVTIRGKKPDKTVFEYTPTFDDNGSVVVSTTEQMTIIPGPVECELVFTSGTTVVATANFIMIVEESPWNPDALSESDVYTLTQMVEDAMDETIADALDANIVDTAHIADRSITWVKLAPDTAQAINSAGVWLDDLEARLTSGEQADAELHLGFYLDENGDLCQED